MSRPNLSTLFVVPHTGDVDRNSREDPDFDPFIVVPHTGDVDRNSIIATGEVPGVSVVPHTGDVDRNTQTSINNQALCASSPTRGTWIRLLLLCLVNSSTIRATKRNGLFYMCFPVEGRFLSCQFGAKIANPQHLPVQGAGGVCVGEEHLNIFPAYSLCAG